MTAQTDALSVADQRFVQTSMVDADVHPTPRSFEQLRGYMDPPWREYPAKAWASGAQVFAPPAGGTRADAVVQGGPSGSDPAMMDRQLLEEAGVDYAILLPLAQPYPDPLMGTAAAAAMNRWMAETWLSDYNHHGRYRGSINVAVDDPDGAVAEIDRWGANPNFVQVRMNTYTKYQFGDRRYWPIYRAAVRYGLPVAVHFAKSTGVNMLTPAGFPASYYEWHVSLSMSYAAQITSLIAEGVFHELPELRFVFVEGGISWVVPLFWRMENVWRARDGSGVAAHKPPTYYLANNIRLTTQPVEEPEQKSKLYDSYQAARAGSVLLFSTDYPHWDYDNPSQPLFRRMPQPMRQNIMWKNAASLYGLPHQRPIAR